MKLARAVSDGEVYCAQQHKAVDVMTCFACEKLLEIDLDSRRPKVVCAAAPGDERSG